MTFVRTMLAATFVVGAMSVPAWAQEQSAAELCSERVGEGVEFDDIEPIGAIEACLDAAKAEPDNIDFRYGLARAYDAAEDYEKAHIHYTAAMDGGSLKARAALGQLYEFGLGVDIDYERAAELYQPALEGGVRIAIEGMGKLYETGNGVKQDYARAAELYRQASEDGSDWATASLGWLTENGWGVAQDDVEAVRLYQIAADAGIDFAQNNLATFYENGRGGLAKDPEEAVRLYALASDQGMALASNNLAQHYIQGTGVERDLAKAEDYFRKAISEGQPADVASAQNNLAWMFATEGDDLKDAEALSRAAVAAEPDKATYHDTLAWVLHKDGRSEEALPVIKKAIELDPADEAFSEHLEAIEAAIAG
ncbi:tetratricopeptide repeat protein [Devosia rhizoryzae]|uniref:SEL1-like repeat protein n=1 Tax=Devosia rhizoryzae TaxID=2774137 RepID=A0ABX7C6L6_9HYPH|nr:tetratricopeptide repeat protein [Devosia rhizoryzae]QQR38859.1 SEL1-like repeat protein [Devosia rhizoryzae]